MSQEEGYIKTTTHNYVSRKAVIDGAKQVEIKGRSILHEGVKVRGDIQIVRIGRYCEIGASTTLAPPNNPLNQGKHIPMVIGSHTHIGQNCEIYAAAIGSSEYFRLTFRPRYCYPHYLLPFDTLSVCIAKIVVWIGDNVKFGKRCIIKDNCVIESGVNLGDDTVVPPFTRISATNPTIYHELPPSMAVQMQEISLDRYAEFKQEQRLLK